MKEWRFEVIIKTDRLNDAIDMMLDAFCDHPENPHSCSVPGKQYKFDYELIWHDPYELGDLDYGN